MLMNAQSIVVEVQDAVHYAPVAAPLPCPSHDGRLGPRMRASSTALVLADEMRNAQHRLVGALLVRTRLRVPHLPVLDARRSGTGTRYDGCAVLASCVCVCASGLRLLAPAPSPG